MHRVILLIILGVTLILILKLPELLPMDTNSYNEKISFYCNYSHEYCSGIIPGIGETRINVSPKNMPSMQPLFLTVSFSDNTGINSIQAQFNGIDMNMGMPFFTLELARDESWHGQGYINYCSINPKMIWAINLNIKKHHFFYQSKFIMRQL